MADLGNLFGSFVEGAKTGQELRDSNYKYMQNRAQARALRESIDPKTGKPVGLKYIQKLIEAGVDVDPATAQASRVSDLFGLGAKTAQNATTMEALGAKPKQDLLLEPDELARNQPDQATQTPSVGARFGVKPKAPASDNVDMSWADGVPPTPGTSTASTTGTTDVAAGAQTEPTNASGEGTEAAPLDLGSTRIKGQQAGTYKLPDIEVPTSERPATNDDFFSTFARNTDTSKITSGVAQAGKDAASPDDASLLTWTPQDDGSNVYQQYKSALDSQLKSGGYTSADDYLKRVYTSTLAANAPTAPNEGLLALGAEGIAKYRGEQQAYIAGLQQAKGKATAAVTEARGKLAEFAQKYGVNTVEQRKTEVGNGLVLRDPAKRDQAAALIVNMKNIENTKADLASAGVDGARLELVAPSVIRAYATSINPSMQLSEGNLAEVGAMLFPEAVADKAAMGKLVGALALYITKGDKSLFQTMISKVSATAPAQLQARLQTVLDHAAGLNAKNLQQYAVTAPTAPPATPPGAPGAPAAPPAKPPLPFDPAANAKKPAAKKDIKPKAPAIGTMRKGPGGRNQWYTSEGWKP